MLIALFRVADAALHGAIRLAEGEHREGSGIVAGIDT
jgi:hypothetical protein